MIHFGTGGWRAIIADEFTKANLRLLAAGLCSLMTKEGYAGEELCVGYDRRFLAKESAHWIAEVLAGYGFRTLMVNRSSPTPLVMYVVKTQGMPYGMMVTASHNPAIYNGVKVFTAGGRDADRSVTDRIEAEIAEIDETQIRSVDYDEALRQGLIREDNPELADGVVVMLRESRDAQTTFELQYLASLTGAVVAGAEDLITMDNKIYYRARRGGFKRVAILHRMFQDRKLDPLCFDETSVCGVPHLMEVYMAGNVAVINAPGCALAEDRGLYAFIPAMIRYYLDEEPLLPNVPTYLPWYPDQRDYILEHLDQLFIKDVSGDMRNAAIRGTILSPSQRKDLSAAIEADPRRYIAQEILAVEKLPVRTSKGELVPARCDFRAYTVHSDSIRVWMGGLSRFTVHNPDGSADVGFKDTWVMAE